MRQKRSKTNCRKSATRQPYWSESMASCRTPATTLPEAVDVAVIGGGLMGVCTTYWLSTMFQSVLLIEARRLGLGSTCRNAGIALPGRRPLEDPQLFDSVLQREGIDAMLEQRGHLALATNAEIWQKIKQESCSPCDTGAQIEAWGRSDCEDFLRLKISKGFLGGRWYAGGRVLDPIRFLYGMAAGAIRRGAQLTQKTRVTGVEACKRGWAVLTSRGNVSARDVVFACHARVCDFVPELKETITPCRGQVLSTSAIDPVFPCGMAVDWGTVYWRQTQSGEIVLGGMRGLDSTRETSRLLQLNPRIQSALEQFLPQSFPGFPTFQVERRWSGIMDCTIDGKPLIGPVTGRRGQWLIAGFGGHGIPPALGAGRALAKAIGMGKLPDSLNAYRPNRFLRSSTRVVEAVGE